MARRVFLPSSHIARRDQPLSRLVISLPAWLSALVCTNATHLVTYCFDYSRFAFQFPSLNLILTVNSLPPLDVIDMQVSPLEVVL